MVASLACTPQGFPIGSAAKLAVENSIVVGWQIDRPVGLVRTDWRRIFFNGISRFDIAEYDRIALAI